MKSFLPIVHRELSVASRRSGTYSARVGAAALVGGILLAMVGTILGSATWVSVVTFKFLTLAIFACCLLSGVYYTADALSRERREGTLGLLFLTDLRGYDVVLGKLAVTSLNACFALLAVVPFLAVPIMMGGVSIADLPPVASQPCVCIGNVRQQSVPRSCSCFRILALHVDHRRNECVLRFGGVFSSFAECSGNQSGALHA